MSCCGRGGSWFKKCGSVGNTRLQHTWYEGIQSCKARSQSKTVLSNQLNVDNQKDIDSSHGADTPNYKEVIMATKKFSFTSVNTSTPMLEDTTSVITSTYTPDNVSITKLVLALRTNSSTNTLMISSNHTSASTSIIKQGCELLLKILNLFFFIFHVSEFVDFI